MSRVISIITAVYRPDPGYLRSAYESIRLQELEEGWSWQWVVQQDGHAGDLSRLLPSDPRISPGNGRRGGACTARTLGLSRADGEFIKNLDADDMLTPGALGREIQILSAYPDIGWTTTRALDLLPDGTTAGVEYNPAEGRIRTGSVLSYWKSHNYIAQVHPTTLCIRRELLFALGGWIALPASEDTGLLLAADAVSDGYFIADTGLLYRKWPGQVTSRAEHSDEIERSARMRVIEARAEALASRHRQPGPGYG